MGEVKGEAKALLIFLSQREVRVSEAARERIMECRDQAQLEEWLHRAVTITSVDELFDS
ncbi:hypothetical protein AB0L25_24695 [Spirillospora sp. NPDC052242]